MPPNHIKKSARCLIVIFELAVSLSLALPLSACQSTKSSISTEERIDSLIGIIQSKLDNGKTMQAQFETEPLLKEHPTHPKVLTIMGLIDLALRNNQRAVKHLKEAYVQDPTAGAALNLSSAYIAARNYPKAIKTLESGIKIAKDTKFIHIVRLYHNKALIHELRGEDDLAILGYQQALYHSPGYILTLKNFGNLLEKNQRLDEAYRIFEKFSYACPACYYPVKKLARYALKKKRYQSALSFLNTFIRNSNILPHNEINAKKFIARIQRAARSKKPDRSISIKGKTKNLNRL